MKSEVRPTLKVIKQLPRDSFRDPTAYDLVQKLAGASQEAREHILSELRLHRLEQPLLEDARSYFDHGTLPQTHAAGTNARTTKNGRRNSVYEVRSRSGAAWRGGIILVNGAPWLAFTAPHDEFHEGAARAFSSEKQYMPSTVDIQLRDDEDAERASQAEDIVSLIAMIEVLADAVRNAPTKKEATIPHRKDRSFRLAFEIDLDDDVGVDPEIHNRLSEVTVTMRIDAGDIELRRRLLSLYVPFLQPDPSLVEPSFDTDNRTIVIMAIMTYAQLAQALVTATTGDSPKPMQILEPAARHFFEARRLAGAFVNGHALQALCGEWMVPTKEGEQAAHLPICGGCEDIHPTAQVLANLTQPQ